MTRKPASLRESSPGSASHIMNAETSLAYWSTVSGTVEPSAPGSYLMSPSLSGGGMPNGGGIPNGANPRGGGQLSAEDRQQFSREAAQRLADAEALRQQLEKQGQPTGKLDDAIQNLRQMAQGQYLEDTRTAASLRSKVIDGLKDFEFGLRRKLGDGDSTRVLLERSGDVPPAYKQHVEEYYRSIGRGGAAPPKKP